MENLRVVFGDEANEFIIIGQDGCDTDRTYEIRDAIVIDPDDLDISSFHSKECEEEDEKNGEEGRTKGMDLPDIIHFDHKLFEMYHAYDSRKRHNVRVPIKHTSFCFSVVKNLE